ncbi:MAG: BMP family protein [Firmicutes bacterium]|nr:BMP family protein [Bacillota bacterium]
MKKIISLLLVLLAGLMVTACSGSDTKTETLKAALLTGGPVNDGGWNQMAYEGLMGLEDIGYEVSNTENVQQDGQKQALQAYCDQGYNLVIGHGYEWGDALTEMANKYPDIKFLQIGGNAGGKVPNLTSGEFKSYELGYIGGKIAAATTTTKKFGFIGAAKIPTLIAEITAIKGAIKDSDPTITVAEIYTGSWTDVAAGKKAAEQMINQGIDTILGIGDACDAGAIQAIDEANAAGKDVKFIGWTGDFYSAYQKDFIVTSCIQDVQGVIKTIGQEVKDDKFVSRYWLPDVASGMLHIGEWSPTATDAQKAAGEAAVQDIKDGKVTPRSIFDLAGVPASEYYDAQELVYSK